MTGWTQVAHVIAVNNPPPIGFSSCESAGPSCDGYSCGDWNDALVAKANHQFLTNLFTKDFPDFSSDALVLTGESYAGVNAPAITREILATPGPLNLWGLAVGDGCMGTEVLCGGGNPDKGSWYQLEFLDGNGQVSEKNYRAIRAACAEEKVLRSGVGQSAPCNASLKQ